MINIAVLASGNGSNAENISLYFASSPFARVRLIITDNSEAGVLQRAEKLNIENKAFTRAQIREAVPVMKLLRAREIDYIVLAGFLSLVPGPLVKAYEGRIVNIHPALLPAYGGKGMYGDRVHSAVIAAGEKRSGITIHMVNEHYDQGAVIAQYQTDVSPDDSPGSLARKIHALEYEYFPKVIENEIRKLNK